VRAASGLAAAPPSSVMNSLRFMLDMGISPLSYGVAAENQAAGDDARLSHAHAASERSASPWVRPELL